MWIIPKNFQHYSPSVRATVASNSDLSKLSDHLEQSLMWRSTLSQLPTWLTRWKRVKWFRHLCGRILKPFLWDDFETALMSSLPDIPVSHSAQQAEEKEQMTQDTYGLTSTGQLTLFAPQSAFLKMWRDTYPLASEKSLPIWLASDIEWETCVVNQRGEYSQRVKQAHRTSEKESLSWPTITQQYDMERSGKNGNQGTYLLGAVKEWPTVTTDCVSSRKKKYAQGGTPLQFAVENWPTPTTQDSENLGGPSQLKRNSLPLNTIVGLHDLDKSNTRGKSQESSNWATPNTLDALPPRSPEGVEKQATGARKGRMKPANLREQVDPLSCEIYQKNWLTPKARDFRGVENHILKNGGINKRKTGETFSIGLPTQAHLETLPEAKTEQKKLNPDWVEQLMGLEVGWTQFLGVTDPSENRIDRLRLLGNGVVPQTAEKAFTTLLRRLL